MGDANGAPVPDLTPPEGFWRSRLAAMTDLYMGVPLSKLPEDLRSYEHLLWAADPLVVVEVGVQYGGSALWFRDRMADIRRYRPGPQPCFVGIDLDISLASKNISKAPEGIHLLEGDIVDPAMARMVTDIIGPEAHALVIDDGAHTYDATLSALNRLSPLVGPDGFYVVEDTSVDIEALRSAAWPRGAGRAVQDWLASPAGGAFRVRRDMERYGITSQPGGYLQRVSDGRPGRSNQAAHLANGPDRTDLLALRRHLAVACSKAATALRRAESRLDPGGTRRSAPPSVS